MKLQNYEIICRKIIRNKYLWRYRYRYKNYVDWLRKEIPTRENLQDYIDRYNLVEADSSCYAEEYTNVFLDYLRIDDAEELFEEVKRLQRKEYGSSI